MTGSLATDLERLLLPNACVVCESVISVPNPDALLCAVCLTRLRPLPMGCKRCSQPLPPIGPCRFCADWCTALARVGSALWLGPEARALVHYLKYEHCPNLARLLAELIADRVPAPESGWLVPVPSGPRRLRQRGYNQAALITRELSKLWRLPVARDVLHRSRESGSQTALTPAARLANVAGAFTAQSAPATARHTLRCGAGSVILVDDVLTTGATLNASAQALSLAGWSPVTAVTFARAMPFEVRAAG